MVNCLSCGWEVSCFLVSPTEEGEIEFNAFSKKQKDEYEVIKFTADCKLMRYKRKIKIWTMPSCAVKHQAAFTFDS